MTLAEPETLSELYERHGNRLVQLDTDLLTEITTWWIGPGERVHTCAVCEAVVSDPIDGCFLCEYADELN
jgi:hypothetical protein